MVDARLTAPMEANGPREFYQPATWDGSTVTPLGWRGSADLFTLARANGLIARPEAAPAAAVGDVVRVLSLDLC
jgi:molybdopterin molybdotransferase